MITVAFTCFHLNSISSDMYIIIECGVHRSKHVFLSL